MAESEINPYASSAAPQDTSVRTRLPLISSSWFFVFLLGLLTACVLVLPARFKTIYEDFEVELPIVTQFALHGSRPLIVTVLGLLFVAKEFVPCSAKLKRNLNLAMALAVMIVGLLFAFALFTPLVHLISDLN